MGNVQMEARQIRYGSTNVEEALKTGGGGAKTLAELTDIAIETPSNGQVLKYDATSEKWINSSDFEIYSDEERVVAEWFGKPLYRKTFISSPESATYNIDVSALSIDKLISRAGTFTRTIAADNIQQKAIEYRTESPSNNTYGIVAELRGNNLYIDIAGYSVSEITEIRITIQYTKTTDTLNSNR